MLKKYFYLFLNKKQKVTIREVGISISAQSRSSFQTSL
jgi:hypothetical protein